MRVIKSILYTYGIALLIDLNILAMGSMIPKVADWKDGYILLLIPLGVATILLLSSTLLIRNTKMEAD